MVEILDAARRLILLLGSARTNPVDLSQKMVVSDKPKDAYRADRGVTSGGRSASQNKSECEWMDFWMLLDD